MKKIVVFQFTVFDENIKERAEAIAWKFPGVTKVIEVEGEEGQLEVRGEFSTFELTKELMKIDESVETIKIVPDGVTEPEVKNQQQDEGKPPINIPKASKWGSDVASSSNGRGVQAYEFLGQAIDVAILAKDMGVGAAKQAKDIGVGAAGKAIVFGMDYYRNKNKEKEVKARVEPKLGVGKREFWGQLPEERRKQGFFEEMKQKKAREEEERRRRKQAEEMKQKKIWEEKMRKQDEEMKQRKIKLEKEKEKMKEKNLAIKEEEKKQKIWQEMMRKQALKNNSGRTTWTGPAGSFWGTLSTKLIGETSASAQTQRPGSTQNQGLTQRPKKESRGVDKKGKNHQ